MFLGKHDDLFLKRTGKLFSEKIERLLRERRNAGNQRSIVPEFLSNKGSSRVYVIVHQQLFKGR